MLTRHASAHPRVSRNRGRWWMRPLHFALIGAVLFAAADRRGLLPAAGEPRKAIAAAAGEVDDELLFQEALERAFDRRDPIVRQRLVALARYLGLDEAADDATLEREARALGLERSDPTVRRHLIEMMRLAAGGLGAADMPDDAALRAYYAEHAERFARPARTTLTQVYLSRDRRGDDVTAAAESVLAQLRAQGISPAAAAALGDPFVRGAHVADASGAQLARSFGPAFAAAVAELPQGVWSGPVASPYGLHLIFVEARRAAAPQPFETARNRVVHELLRARSAERQRALLVTLRARYDVRIVPAVSAAAGAAPDWD